MNHNTGMNRFFVEAVRVFGPRPGVQRWQYRIRDKDQCRPNFGAKVVASTFDPEIADKIAAVLEGGDKAPAHERDWQMCLYAANANAERARHEGREAGARWQSTVNALVRERDTWRNEYNRVNNELAETRRLSAIGWTAEEVGKLIAERDEARGKVEAIKSAMS